MENRPANILIVDDEADIRELLEISLGRMGMETRAVADLAAAEQALEDGEYDLCLTDMRLPDGDGIDLVRRIQENQPLLPVAVITAYGSTESAVESLKAGAFDFVTKPVDIEKLRALVDTALKLDKQGADHPPEEEEQDGLQLLGQVPQIEKLRGTIGKLARSQAPVYITGESGTGKELVARLIHARGPRADHPFVPVNCGAIPSELMESELFGHRKGSFTGATRDKPGLFQSANGGTLFLDEIAELPLHMQVKLLRAIQERSVRPVGSETEVEVDVRIICATHKPLAEQVERGEFREDLYYRLNVIEVTVPPMRERRGDIRLLSDHLLARIAKANGLTSVPKLTKEASLMLGDYHFPGNVRELENILERAVTLAEGDQIGPELIRLQDKPDQAQAEEASYVPESGNIPLPEHLENIEKQAIRRALEAAKYNKTKAAELLGISFRALRYRLKKLKIEDTD